MASVSAFLVFFWVLLYVQTQTQGGVTELSYASVTEYKDMYTLFVTFKATPPVEAVWWRYSGVNVPERLPEGADSSFSLRGSSGVAWRRVKKTDVNITTSYFLNLGDLKTHFLELSWNIWPFATRSFFLTMPMAKITPGTDVAYAAGQPPQVTVSVLKNRDYMGYLETDDAELYVTGEFIDNVTKKVVIGEEPSFLQQSSQTQGNVNTTTITFRTDQYPVNGVFFGELYAPPKNVDKSPILWVSEKIFLKVHEDWNSGPYPDGYLSVSFDESNRQMTCDHYFCTLHCTAHGNELDKVSIYKEDVQGVRTDQGAAVDMSRPFQLIAVLDMNATSPDTAGKYVCQASMAAQKEDTVSVSGP